MRKRLAPVGRGYPHAGADEEQMVVMDAAADMEKIAALTDFCFLCGQYG